MKLSDNAFKKNARVRDYRALAIRVIAITPAATRDSSISVILNDRRKRVTVQFVDKVIEKYRNGSTSVSLSSLLSPLIMQNILFIINFSVCESLSFSRVSFFPPPLR